MMKKLISVIIAAMLIAPAFPTVGFALNVSNLEPEDYYKEYSYNKEGAFTSNVLNDDGQEVELEEEKLPEIDLSNVPSRFDSRDYGRVTSVKDQNPLGSCWSFAFCAAAESSLISQGYASSDIDLSEAHLLWFRTANYVEGSDIPVQQDRINKIKNTFDDGGNDFDAMSTAARWSGFTTEKKFPYIRSTDTTAMQFDEEDMFAADYNLVSARKLTKNNMNEVKQSIMQYGAVTAQIYYTKDALNYLDNGECNHYQKKQSATNHAVTVVGWDDNYDADKFIIKPAAGNGAWLIKNSWGEETNDAGYFWLSYYDRSVGDFMEVVAKPAGEYDNNYQYDGVTCTAAIAYQGKAYGANIFTAKGYETIGGCGFYTYSSTAINVTLSIYTGIRDASDPKSGTLCESKTVSVNKEGYFTVDFNGEYDVEPGEKFSIVALYSNASGTAMIPYESRTTFDYTYGTQAGQSFYSSNSSAWTDVATTTNRGNIPLKVFTKNTDGAEVVSASFNTLPKTEYNVGDEIDLSDVKLNVKYANGQSAVIERELLHISGIDTSEAGVKEVSVWYMNTELVFNVTVIGDEEPIEEEPVEDEPVAEVVPESVEIAELPSKTEYFEGEKLDTAGLEVKIICSDGSSFTTADYKVEADLSEAGNITVKVIYGELTAEFTVAVKAVTISKVEIYSLPTKTEYFAGDSVSFAGLALMATYNNGKTEIVSNGITTSSVDTSAEGKKIVTAVYKGLSTSFEINVTEVVPVSIKIVSQPSKTEYFAGDTAFDTTGLKLEVTYNNGTAASVDKGFTCTGFDTAAAGIKKITVMYEGFTAQFDITVKAVNITKVEIYSLPTKTEYFAGDSVSFAGLALKATYNNGKTEIVSNGITTSSVNTSTAGKKTVTASYKGFSTSFEINVTAVAPVSIKIVSKPSKTEYFAGDTAFDTTGLKLEVTYNNGTTAAVDKGFTCTGFDTAAAGTKKITVKYEGFTAQFEITVKAKTVEEPILNPGEIIKAKSGSNTVIDEKYKTISGLDFGIKSLDKYIELANGYTYTCSYYGSGGQVKIMKNCKVVDTYSLVIYGDVNGDGWCDKNDYNIAYDIYYRRRSSSSIHFAQLMACDLTFDGYLNTSDLEIMNKAVNLIKKFDKNKSVDTLKRTSSYYNDYVELMPQTKTLYDAQQAAKHTSSWTSCYFNWLGW